jgi:hypothetical protein
MDINFHYAAIKAIAWHAGFSRKEAQTIAYASQYVDDAVLHEKVRLSANPQVPGIRFDPGENLFDPICTAHKKLDYAKAITNPDSHRLVYVSFHYIPSLEGTEVQARQTRKGCTLAEDLVKRALGYLADPRGETRAQGLVRLGIALHSFADTWAHQGFSGYWDWDNNDIGKIRKKAENGTWKRCDPVSTFLCYAAPDIGHAEAGTLPDQSDAVWDCEPPKLTKNRSNCDEFLAAARAIFDLLRKQTKDTKPWKSLATRLKRCFLDPAGKDAFSPGRRNASSSWKKSFPGLGFKYDDTEWISAALTPRAGILDVLGDLLDLDPRDFDLGPGRHFFYFHATALEQRRMVLQRVPVK